MKLSRLNGEGVAFFAEYLARLRAGEAVEVPRGALFDSSLSTEVGDIEVDPGLEFKDRFASAEYLHRLLDGWEAGIERDVGLWAWLSLLYFEQLCPKERTGKRKVGEQARYIPVPNAFQRFYRHLLLGPFLIYRAHVSDPGCARVMLVSPLSSPGDIVEQLASRQELVTNRAVMAVATALYVDDTSSQLKRGSGGKAGGSPRRLADFVNQVDLTYDLYAMAPDELLGLLPKEFERFKPKAPASSVVTEPEFAKV